MATAPSPAADRMLEMLPPFYAGDPVGLGVLRAFGREIDRLDAFAQAVTNGLFPHLANDAYGLLSLWEEQVGLPVAPPGRTKPQRRATLLGRIRARNLTSGRDWVAAASSIIGADFDFAINTPGPYQITLTVPFSSGTDAFDAVLERLRPITPAHIEIVVGSGGGFIVDEGLVDDDVI